MEQTLKIWISGIITVIGFISGMLLAGVGGLSTKTLRALNISFPSSGSASDSESNSESNSAKIEKYWQKTGLSIKDVIRLVSNDKCYSSEKYFSACLNVVAEGALNYNLELSVETGELVKIHSSERFERLDEKNEKELLTFYLNRFQSRFHLNSSTNSGLNRIDFNSILTQLLDSESEAKRPMLAAQMVNAYLSVYFDPHTYIMPANYYEEVGSKIERSKFFVGISYEKINGAFYIRKVFKNSDAEFSGLKVNDKILAINSVPLGGANYSKLSALLKNEKLQILNFKIERKHKILSLDLRRSYRQLRHVQYDVLSAGKDYGLISLNKFNPGVCSDIASELRRLNKNTIAGLVLDLRDNPGGQLNEAACIAGLFLGKNKKAYYVEYFDQSKANEVVLTSEELAYRGPLVVLVNGASASASELLAGVLQEAGRALIMGERTFGKGTFQEPEEWVMNSKVSLYKTQGFYLLPSGKSTQLKGVTPDIALPAESDSVRGESQIYFKPIPAATKNITENYTRLKNTEAVKNTDLAANLNTGLAVDLDTDSACNKKNTLMIEDLYLRKSLDYLNCGKVSDSKIAQKITQSDRRDIN